MQLPKGINAEITLRKYSHFIHKVRLFQLSNASFALSTMRSVRPVVCMAGDHVVRVGELAEAMYFVRRGVVKVVCADDEEVAISYLSEGCYFGEIGVLAKGLRSASVVALTNCTLFEIKKEELLELLSKFTKHKNFLILVAQQRLETTFTRDLKPSDNEGNFSAVKNAKLERPVKAKEPLWIDVVWAVVVFSSFLWSTCYTFLALSFNIDIMMYGAVLVVDIASVAVYILDLIFQAKRLENAVSLRMLIELLATLPIDYIYLASGNYINWLRFIRFLKVVRLPSVNLQLKPRFSSPHVYNIACLVLFSLISSHIFACILHVLASHEYTRGGRFDHGCLVLCTHV